MGFFFYRFLVDLIKKKPVDYPASFRDKSIVISMDDYQEKKIIICLTSS